jgi:uncharacterized iron-regulated protein
MAAARAADDRAAGAPPPGSPGLITGAQTYYVNAPRQLVVATDAAREASLVCAEFVVCGEHHDLAADHRLEASLLRAMADAADRDGVPLVLGLEMVERAFQSALDAYSARSISDAELYTATEWATRWVWPWEQYLPILQLARDRGVGLVALNTDTEVLRRVPIEGLESLNPAQRASLVPDPEGFVSATTDPFFGRYTNAVIMPSFGVHVSQRYMDQRATQAGFFSARILRDEAMASRAVAAAGDRGRALVLVGADHVKYELGIERRMRRYAALAGRPQARIETVLLSPTPADTLSASETRLALALGPEEEALHLARYIMYPAANGGVTPSVRRDDAWSKLHIQREDRIIRTREPIRQV